MSTPRIERETTITWNEEEDEAMVWSASPLFQRRMDRLGIGYYKSSEREGTEESRYYKIPKGFVGIIRTRKKRELTEEQRKAEGDKLRAGREKQRAVKKLLQEQ